MYNLKNSKTNKRTKTRFASGGKGKYMWHWTFGVIGAGVALAIILPLISFIRYQDIFTMILQVLAFPFIVVGAGLTVILLYYTKILTTQKWRIWISTQKIQVILIAALFIIGGIAIVPLAVSGRVFTLGEFGGPPPEAPVGFQKGYSVFTVKNATTGETFQSGTVTIVVLDYATETIDQTVVNGQPFYVDESSMAFIIHSGYHNMTTAVWAREDIGNPYENTVYLYPMANESDFSAQIIKINNTYGSFDSSDLVVGHHTLLIEASLALPSRDQSYLGVGYYVPKPYRGSLGTSLNVSNGGLFISFNGSIGNVTVSGLNYSVFNIAGYGNATFFTSVFNTRLFQMEIDILGPITNITFFQDQIDNYADIIYNL